MKNTFPLNVRRIFAVMLLAAISCIMSYAQVDSEYEKCLNH